MMRPARRRIMPRSTARDRRKAAVRLTSMHRLPVLVRHAGEEHVAVEAGVVDENVDLAAERGFGVRHELLDLLRVAEIAGDDERVRRRVRRRALPAPRAWCRRAPRSRPACARRGRWRRRWRRLRRSPARACRSVRTCDRSLRSGQLRDRRVDFCRRADGQRLRALDDALGETGQHLAGADLDKRVDARCRRARPSTRASAPCRSPARPGAAESPPGR